MNLELINQLLFWGIFTGLLVFVILYSFRSPWWETEIGKNMLAFMSVTLGLAGLGAAYQIIGPEWFDEHRGGVTFWSRTAFFLVVWWRVVILIKVQRLPKREPQRARADDDEREVDPIN